MSNAQFPRIKSFEDAKKYLNGKSERPCGNNTRIIDSGSIIIRHFATNIITYEVNGKITLRNGGYFTATTKERLNNFIPNEFSIWQNKGLWTVSNRNLQITRNWKEGITLLADGNIENYEEESIEEETKKLTKKINKYAKAFVDAFIAGNIEHLSGGDCWYCLMKVEGSGQSLGDETNNTDHLLSHIEEDYFVPSLLMNIVNEGKNLSIFDKSTIGQIWGYTNGEASDWQKNLLRRNLTKLIANYMKDRLGVAH